MWLQVHDLKLGNLLVGTTLHLIGGINIQQPTGNEPMASSSAKRKRDAAFRSSYNASSSRRSRLRREVPFFPDPATLNRIPSSTLSHVTSRVHQPRAAANVASEQDARRDLERGLDDDLDQVVMAIDMKECGTVGCCYYVAQEEKLYILGDIRSSGTEAVETCLCTLVSIMPSNLLTLVWSPVKLEVKPTVVLTSTRAEHLIKIGRQELRQGDGNLSA